MPVTPWLRLLDPHFHTANWPAIPATRNDRRDPWRHAATAYRSNPFRPPSPQRPSRGTRSRPSQHRWLARQRQL